MLMLVSFVLLILATVLFLGENRKILWPEETSTDPHIEKYLGKIPRWRTNLELSDLIQLTWFQNV